MPLDLNLDFVPRHGEAVEFQIDVARITAGNSGPFTFHGTNSYLVGRDRPALIDPGPDDPAHLDALLRAIGGRKVSHILLTHTHRDHSSLAPRLRELTGAPILAEGPHRPARAARPGESDRLDASGDFALKPDATFGDGEIIRGDGWAVRAVLTPGHAVNHAAFALEGSGILFSGDHVMGWSTTIVAPPDGSMSAYMRSLDKLLERDDRVFLPGHGGPIAEPARFMRGLKAHRKMRERAILERLAAGDRTIHDIVAEIYRDTPAALHGAAGLSVLAHLEDLVAREAVAVETGEPSLEGRYGLGPASTVVAT